MKPAACTIVANNYLAYARVLAESFFAQHPDGSFYTLVVDRPQADVDYEELPFTTIFAEDLGIPTFRNMAFRYTILELNTAVKPWFLRWLHQQHGCPSLLYFDPDILVLSSLHMLGHFNGHRGEINMLRGMQGMPTVLQREGTH